MAVAEQVNYALLTKQVHMILFFQKKYANTQSKNGEVMSKKPCKVQNLVILRFISDCFTEVVKLKIKKLPKDVLSVNPTKGMWRVRVSRLKHDKREKLRIGEDALRFGHHGSRSGKVIGIYDCTNVSHLASMIHDAITATR